MKLTEYTVKNYQFTLVLFIMVVVVGVVTLFTMPRAEDPELKAPFYNIVAVYPGTSPKDMEELIAKPIEEKIYELEDINKIITNIEDGLMVSRIDFKFGVDVDNKYQEVIREVNNLREQFPKDLYKLEVNRFDPTDVNILQVALVSENASNKVLEHYADQLKDMLEKIPTLKNVEYNGLADEIVQVELKMDKIAQLKIPLQVLTQSLQSEAANIPGGSVNVSTKSFTVKTSGKYESLEDIANTVVYNANGKIIYLKDVAEISLKYGEDKHITRINGHRCVLVNAAQKSGVNIAETQKLILPVLKQFEKKLPKNIVMIRHFDQAENVSWRLGNLGEDFLMAIGLVLVTLLPLGFRASSIVAVAIPLSLSLGLVGLNAFGYSLNQLSIVGLVVALGLLVDDSIVVVENIERWLREGHNRKEAAINATKQIGLAVIGCTATLIIAFLPLLFMPGGPGTFIRSLPVAVISSVLASLVVSLTIVPFLASRFLKNNKNPEGNIFMRAIKKTISGTYSRLLDQCLRHPAATIAVASALFIGSLALFPRLGFKLFPTSEKPVFLMNIKMPLQTNLYENNRIIRMIEDSLRRNKGIVYFTSNVGKGNPYIFYNVTQQKEKSDFAQIFIQLGNDVLPDRKKQIIDSLREQFSRFPMAKVEVSDFEQGPPVEAPVAIRIFGDNLDSLRRLAASVEQIVKQSRGAIYVNNELNVLKTDLRVDINREKARTLGILTADIDRTVRLAVAGLQIGAYSDESGDDYPILVSAPKEKVATLQTFENLFVNNMAGVAVPLNHVAKIQFETSPPTINRLNKTRFAKITAYTQKGVLANDIYKEVLPALDSLKMPDGYYYSLAGEAESEKETFGSGFATILLLTLFLFIGVLILQFKTFKGILIVISVIPLGVVGGVLMLWASGNPTSLAALIGFIGLTGIEVKNSILLVDFTNQLRRQGMHLMEAIEKAGEIRFLPVVLTSLTAIGGLIPLAMNPNQQISPLAWVLIGGLLSSTLLSRIVTPVLYKLLPPKI
jgi:multidrug efflux pump subunit AcrB